MRLPCRLALIVALLAPAVLRSDTPSPTQWVVTSAKLTGSGGNQYVTSLRIVNPNAAATPVSISLLPASDGSVANTNPATVNVTVPANSTLAIDDVLKTTFATAGSGGLLIQSKGPDPTAPQAVWVLSQTLVVNAFSSTGVQGTNGFAIPAQDTGQLVAIGETAYVPYVSASASSTSGYRTNLFLLSANLSQNTAVTVTLVKGDGTLLGTRNLTLAPYAQTQINDIANSFSYTPGGTGVDTNLTATVTVKSGGPVATGASVIDNAIASISYSPPVKVAIANDGSYGLILNDGFGFSGRLDILNGNADYLSASIVVPNCNGAAYVFPFQAFGADSGATNITSFVSNGDGTISFAGAQPDAAFNGTIYSLYDGSVYGNVTYTRANGSAGTPCPGAGVTYSFSSGPKAFPLP